MVDNPYYADREADKYFFGRRTELDTLIVALTSGRRAIAAVMGGRGMGKSSLARMIQRRLDREVDVFTIRIDRPQSTQVFAKVLEDSLGSTIDPEDPAVSLQEIVRRPSAPRIVLLIDEVEHLLDADLGRDVLENLRIAYERSHGRLGVVVFGGSRLYQLLTGGASPFLRSAQWLPLRGMNRDECRDMLCTPLSITLPNEVCDTVWHRTNGHPLLLQRTLEDAVNRWGSTGGSIADSIQDILAMRADESLDRTLFSVWWDNLMPRGQALFRTLVAEGAPLKADNALSVLGERWLEWFDVLETTGVAGRAAGYLMPRGELFRQWFEKNIGVGTGRVIENGLSSFWMRVNVPQFEQNVIKAVARWAEHIHETAGYHFRLGDFSGNHRLELEAHFQIDLMGHLRQHHWIVEGEALSVQKNGRSDVKIRDGVDGPRACGELKRWEIGNRGQYTGIIEQVCGYALPGDTFAFTVVLDCRSESLLSRYREDCGILEEAIIDIADERRLPALITQHTRGPHPVLRVYHLGAALLRRRGERVMERLAG